MTPVMSLKKNCSVVHYCRGMQILRLKWSLGRISYRMVPSWEWIEPIGKSSTCLTHWGQVTHICVGNLTIIGSDNGLSPGRRQAIVWTNDGILLIGPLGTNFGDNLIEIQTFSFKKKHLKVSSAKWRPFCLGLSELNWSNSLLHVLWVKYTPIRKLFLYKLKCAYHICGALDYQNERTLFKTPRVFICI